MPELPDRPDIDQLRRQARELLRAASDGEPRALTRLRAVSERTTLSAAQLAIAREYRCPSWLALSAEVRRRRRLLESAGSASRAGDRGNPLAATADRWSFGGGIAIDTSAGMLMPEVVIAGSGHAVLDGSLLPAGDGKQASGPRRPAPGLPFARLMPWRARATRRERRRCADSAIATLRSLASPADVTVSDDQGARYALYPEGMSGKHGSSSEAVQPLSVRLGIDPAPAKDVRWLQVQSQQGAATRLLRSARPVVRVGQLAPVTTSPAERELPEHALGPGAPDEVQRPDGPRRHLDIGAALPPIDGVVLQVDTLVGRPDGWRLYLRAIPGWWNYSEDGHRKRNPVSVQAEDDRGGIYLSTFDGSTGYRGREELALRFRPRIDPLATALRLTCSGASEEIVVELGLVPDDAD